MKKLKSNCLHCRISPIRNKNLFVTRNLSEQDFFYAILHTIQLIQTHETVGNLLSNFLL